MDSPLTGLDVQTRQEFNTIIEGITESGISVVMATSPYEIPDAITNIAVLKNGAIINTFSKADFKPEMVASPDDDVIDKGELRSLLNTHEAMTYHQIVSMNKLNVKYSDNVILNNVNWQVNPRRSLGLAGP
ncbi:ATP-binding cassette domain-containing protein [Mucilaginibacter humi]|uniref:hypothetical protein n=1 Tax=Mucilaginibacter humi TaxID=2732510 RepID=UPI001FE26D2E|nr:hypothetical protein [Mucilaginibacter humi]